MRKIWAVLVRSGITQSLWRYGMSLKLMGPSISGEASCCRHLGRPKHTKGVDEEEAEAEDEASMVSLVHAGPRLRAKTTVNPYAVPYAS